MMPPQTLGNVRATQVVPTVVPGRFCSLTALLYMQPDREGSASDVMDEVLSESDISEASMDDHDAAALGEPQMSEHRFVSLVDADTAHVRQRVPQ